ncbi:PHO86 [Candida metapsilosis]|uniref:PHO86 n=1 Tax=Candida metapsilosis TaxID=273372 RepID=A0A8H8DE16_9ASCO|nr:PHO86 [Candida metapsilosis]
MVAQKDIDLNEPLDEKVSSTLSKSALTPELTKAAITLQGDRYKQLQAKLTKFIIWHPYFVTFYIILFPSVLVYYLWDFISISESMIELYYIISRNKRDFFVQIIVSAPVMAGIFGIFGFIAYILGDQIGAITDKYVAQKYCDYTFGFDVKEFASDPKTPLLKNGKNTELVVYRNQPIAVATLKPDWDQCTEENFIVNITGVHVRKVFAQVDFDQFLFEWAILRSRELYQEFLIQKNSKVKNGTIFIVTDAYSFDTQQQKLLARNGFRLLSSSWELNPFNPSLKSYEKALNKLFGISRGTFGLLLTTEKDDVELLKGSDILENGQVRKRH